VYSIFGETLEKKFEKTIDFKKSGTIYLKNINGDIEVKSWENEKVEVKALIQVKSEEKTQILLDEIKILINTTDDRVEINVDYPDREEDRGFWDLLFGGRRRSFKVSFWLTVPKVSNLDMNTTNGGINIYDIEGKVFSKSTNGSIQLENILGNTELHTTNGSVSTKNIIGDIDAKTTNGKINLSNIEGNVVARTTNGEILVDILKSIKEKMMNFRTTNGSVTLNLAKDIDADLDAKLTNGKIYTDFPILIKGEISKNSISGKINNGGSLIQIRTTNGEIKILESKTSEKK
jgi:hypothetical protein